MEKLQSKAPRIRFPEFKDEWEHKRLSELLSESKKRNGDLKYDKAEVLSVSGELGIVNQIEHLGRSYAGVSVHQYHVVEVGDIVYTKSPLKANPFGIIKLNKGKAGIVSTLYAVYNVEEKNAYGPFLDYYFSLDANTNRYLRPLVRKGAKNTLQVTNEEAISAEIFAPSISEQTCIASFFTVLDIKIAQLKQKKNLLEQYKKGVMQKLFSQELRFKDENGKEFPKCEKKKFDEIFLFSTGKNIKQNEASPEFETPCVRYGELYHMYIEVIKEVFNKTNLDKTELLFSDGDEILLPSAGEDPLDIGSASALTVANVAIGRTINILKPLKANVYSQIYVAYYINQVLKKRISTLAKGVSISNVYNSDLRTLQINLPFHPEQIKIANFLSALDEKINRTENQIQQTGQYKKGLLQNMFV